MNLEVTADNSVNLLGCVMRNRYLDAIKVLDIQKQPAG